ncbi:MAG: hypothetical protein R3182_12885, partial [Draconibacterium sp.]|nr:hypothetical protein [Draconibacterium sp.]
MDYTKKIRRTELFVYIIVWLIILVMPVLLDSNPSTDWTKVKLEWVRIMPFALVFAIHNFLLFPALFQKKKYWFYLIASVALIISSGYLIAKFGEVMQPLITENRPKFHPEGFPEGLEQRSRPHIPRHGLKGGLADAKNLMIMDKTITSFLVIGFNLAILLVVRRQDDMQRLQSMEKQTLKTELALLKTQI